MYSLMYKLTISLNFWFGLVVIEAYQKVFIMKSNEPHNNYIVTEASRNGVMQGHI